MKPDVRNAILRRAVFNQRNSTCGSARVMDLSQHWWWTDNSDAINSLYIHACRWSDRTYHRVWPRPIPGYACKRLEMKNRMYGAKLFWLYDANVAVRRDTPSPQVAGSEPRRMRCQRCQRVYSQADNTDCPECGSTACDDMPNAGRTCDAPKGDA